MVSVLGSGVGEGVGEGVLEGEGVGLARVGNGLGSAQAAQRMRMVRMARCLLIGQPLSIGKDSLSLSSGAIGTRTTNYRATGVDSSTEPCHCQPAGSTGHESIVPVSSAKVQGWTGNWQPFDAADASHNWSPV